MKNYTFLVLGGLLLLSGCTDIPLDEVQNPKPITPVVQPELLADAGVPIGQPGTESVNDTFDYARSRYFPSRSDAFAMLASERAFDRQQTAERILSEGGGFSQYFELPEQPGETNPPRLLPVPTWRLAGVMFSNGVVALLEVQTSMGIKYFDIYPGATVAFDNQQWFVVSIHRGEGNEADYAVLRRVGGPFQQVVVPIQQRGLAPGGTAGGTGGGSTGGGRTPPGAGAGGGGNSGSQAIRD